jgi:polysaccharide biosynthesis transport protein
LELSGLDSRSFPALGEQFRDVVNNRPGLSYRSDDVRPAPNLTPDPVDQNDFISFNDIIAFIKEYYRTILMSMIVMIALSGVYVYRAVPIYTAQARVLLDPNLIKEMPKQLGELNVSIDATYVQTQVVVLKSEKILSAVLNKLKLLDYKEFQLPAPSMKARVKGWFLSDKSAVNTSELDFIKQQVAIAKLRSGLEVRRVGLTYAMDIAFSSAYPKLSAQVANAIVEAYIADQLDIKIQAARQGSQWLEKRIDELRTLMNSAARTVQKYKSTYDFRISKTGKSKDQQAGKAKKRVTIEELDSKAKTSRKIYESFLLAYAQAVQRQSNPFSNARVVTKAKRPLVKSRPRTKLVLILGGLVGLLFGFGIALVQRLVDSNVRTVSEIKRWVGVDCLAQIPDADCGFDSITQHPHSSFSNRIKALRANVHRRKGRRKSLALGILSTQSGEGTSQLVYNFATLLTTLGEKVLIVDTDLFNRTLSEKFTSGCEYGILDILDGSQNLDDVIWLGSKTAPDILPITECGEVLVSYGVLTSWKMESLLVELREQYDYIVVDMPPLNPVVEGVEISSMLDEVLMVAKWRSTSLLSLKNARQSLQAAGANIGGVVLTGTKL